MQRVLLGSTDTITTYPRIPSEGPASQIAASATARRIGPTASDATGSYVAATVDPLSTTVQGAHAEGAVSVTLAGAVTVVAGRRYLITDGTTGQEVVVVAVRGGSLSVLSLAEPLPCDIASGSAVAGIAITVALTAAQTANAGAGYVLFRAVIGSVTREWEEAFRVVRRMTSIALTPVALTQTYPVVRKLASAADTTLEEAIRAAWDVVVSPSLAARGVLDEDVMTDDVVLPMHAAAVVLHLARQWPQASAEYIQRLEQSYEQAKQTTWDRIDFATASQDSETPETPEPGSQGPRFLTVSR